MIMLGQYFKALRESIESFLAWFSTALKQTTESYCDLETADSSTTLVAHDGALVSIIHVEGARQLVGEAEFKYIHEKLTAHFQAALRHRGHTFQVVFHYDPHAATDQINHVLAYSPSNLDLEDVLNERIHYVGQQCGYESVYFVLWTHPDYLTHEQNKQAERNKLQLIRQKQLPPFQLTQNVIAAIPELRNTHDAWVNSTQEELEALDISARILEVHEASYAIRQLADPNFTDPNWQACLPGDKVPLKHYEKSQTHISDVLWPSLARQLLPREAENLDLRTVQFGDQIYSCVFVDLLPKTLQPFSALLQRTLSSRIPWRISFLTESDALDTLKFKSMLATVLSFSSEENRLLSDANNLLHYIGLNSDEAIVQLKLIACTWAPEGQLDILRTRTAILARAIQNWGMSDVSEISGDPFEGLIATLPAVSSKSIATPTVLPASEMTYLLPIARPTSPWKEGAQLFRTPDGKPWPFQPGSSLQTTWIDLIYARPGSGKSILSNTLNLALCLKEGLKGLPHIAIIDIGPSSKGFISLLQEALPLQARHQVAYHRLQMSPKYAINPFDTPLGMRHPTPQDRTFLVNFLTLLATPYDEHNAYDGIADMAGLVIDELYKQLADDVKPYLYTAEIESQVDALIKKLNISLDERTTWWEITDHLAAHHYYYEATLAQRHAMPLLADVGTICRTPVVEDLYGKIHLKTGETLISAFSRMISSAIREYPILTGITRFDTGTARIFALDLDEVAKSGGQAADRQTAIMYMLARHTLTRHYYLNTEHIQDIPAYYQAYHQKKIEDIKESPKRIVFDEFHRTAKSHRVREQVITDMREGRKWNIQIALLSQSLDDFDAMMVEFATAIYIMDAGPVQTIEKSAQIFGLSPTAQNILRTQVHGPRETGTTFLAQFATTLGVHTQLLTLTLGPIELWALSTTVEDTLLRDRLYQTLGPVEARRRLARLFPTGSVRSIIESKIQARKKIIPNSTKEIQTSILNEIEKEVLQLT
jgi:intracellular multiplication protein IcmB